MCARRLQGQRKERLRRKRDGIPSITGASRYPARDNTSISSDTKWGRAARYQTMTQLMMAECETRMKSCTEWCQPQHTFPYTTQRLTTTLIGGAGRHVCTPTPSSATGRVRARNWVQWYGKSSHVSLRSTVVVTVCVSPCHYRKWPRGFRGEKKEVEEKETVATDQFQILRKLSQEPVATAMPSSVTPRQLTRLSCPASTPARSCLSVSQTLQLKSS